MDFIYKTINVMMGKVIYIGLAMGSSIYFTRMLHAEGRGDLAMLSTVAGTLVQLFNFGLHSSHIYYISQDREKVNLAEGNIISVLFFSLGISVAIYYILISFPNVVKLSPYLIVMTLGVFVTNLFMLLYVNLLLPNGGVSKYSIYQILPMLFTLGLVMLSSNWRQVDVNLVATMMLVANLLTMLISMKDNLWYKPQFSLEFLKMALSYGLKSFTACLFSYLLLRSDVFMLNYFCTKEEVGYYSVAANLADSVYIVSASIFTILFTKLSSCKTMTDRLALMSRSGKYVVPLLVLMAGMMEIVAEYLVCLLYGEEFLQSVPLLRGLIIASIAIALAGGAFNFFASENRFSESIIITVFAFSINVLLNYLMIPHYFAFGAVLSSVISYMLTAILIYVCMYKYVKTYRTV